VNKVKVFLSFLKLVKRPQPKFTLIPMRESQVLGQKKSKFIIRSKFIVGSNFSGNAVFLFIDILLKLKQQILICVC